MNTITELIEYVDEEISRVTSDFNNHRKEDDKGMRDYKLGFLACLIEVRSYLIGDKSKEKLLNE